MNFTSLKVATGKSEIIIYACILFLSDVLLFRGCRKGSVAALLLFRPHMSMGAVASSS